MSSSLDRQELARRRKRARSRARREAVGGVVQMVLWCSLVAGGGIILVRGGDPWGWLLVLAAVGGVAYAIRVLVGGLRGPRRRRGSQDRGG